MKKTIFMITTVALIFIMCFNFVGCSLTSTNKGAGNTSEEKQYEYVEHRISLLSDGDVIYTDDYVAQTLKATVTPAAALNPKVVWSVAWESSSITADITEYIQIFTEYEGALFAEVRCYKALPGNAIVTVTTEDGGYTDTCKVVFVGIPTSLSVSSASNKDAGGITKTLTTDSSGNFLAYTEGWNKITFNLQLSNIFNSVSSQFNSYTCEVISLTGNIMVANSVEDGAGDKTFYEDTKTIEPLLSYRDDFVVSQSGTTISVQYDFGTLSTDSQVGSSDETYYFKNFYSFIDTEMYTMTIRVTNISGVTTDINIKFHLGAVTDVNLSDSTLEF